MYNFVVRVDTGVERGMSKAEFVVGAKNIGFGGCLERRMGCGPLKGVSGGYSHT